jgi:hypothetical protein
MSPLNIRKAEMAVYKAKLAANTLGSPLTDDLCEADRILSEVRHFAYSVRETDVPGINPEYVTRLISAILGFEVKCIDTHADWALHEAYKRLPAGEA